MAPNFKKFYEETSASISDFPDDDIPVTSIDNTDIVEFSYKNLGHYIENGYHTQQSVMIYGDAGLGKSAIVYQTAKKLAEESKRKFVNWQSISQEEKKAIIKNPSGSFVFVDVRTAQIEPTSITGYMNIRSREGFVEMKPEVWVYLMSRPDSAGILFLDEINQATRQVLNALFEVVLDRGVAGNKFTDAWGVIGAGNRAGEYGNEPLPPALRNRFIQGELRPDPDSWIEWAHDNGIDGSVIAFIESRKTENFFKKPAEATSDNFPSPRQFFSLSRQIQQRIIPNYVRLKKEGKLNEVQSIYKQIGDTAAGLCGVNWAQRFVTFLRYARLFDWASISAKPKDFIKSGQGTSSTDVDKLYQIILIVRDNIVRLLGNETKLTDKEKKDVSIKLIGIFNELNPEFKTILLNYINKKDKNATAEWLSIVLNNKTVEPFKTFALNEVPKIISISNGK